MAHRQFCQVVVTRVSNEEESSVLSHDVACKNLLPPVKCEIGDCPVKGEQASFHLVWYT